MTEKAVHIRTDQVTADFVMDLDVGNPPEKWLLDHFNNNICYEAEVTQVMLKVLRPGDRCVDVGANVGFFTLLMSRMVGADGLVWAFEPGTNNLPKLKHNFELNQIANVKLIEKPAWSKVEPIRFWLDADSSGGNTVWDPGKWWENARSRANPESYEIEATTLDAECDALPTIKLVKIDTEGVEQRILEGAASLLSWRPQLPFILVEFNPFGLEQMGCSGRSLRDYMKRHGYDVFLLQQDGSLPILVPPKTEITHHNAVVVLNAMFSTVDAVAEYWPRAPHA